MKQRSQEAEKAVRDLELRLRNRTEEATRATKTLIERDKTIARLKSELSRERDLRLKDKNLNTQAVARAKDETAIALRQVAAAKEEKRDVEQQVALHLESARLPKGVLQSAFRHHGSLPIQPFVVLLVDGDAYLVRS